MELSGAPKAKLVPATHFEEMAAGRRGLRRIRRRARSDRGRTIRTHAAFPIFDALTVLPWRKNVAWVPGNLHVNGKSWPYCPRTILARQLERARRSGYMLQRGQWSRSSCC